MHTSSASRRSGRPDRTGVEDRRTAVASGVTTLAILGVAFGAMALGVPYFWVAFPVGFGGVLPLVVASTPLTCAPSTPADVCALHPR